MKFIATLSLITLAVISNAFAQRSGLINSGKLLTEGAALHDSAHYKQALAVYDKISRSDTNYVRALYEKALTCESDSQYNQAIAYCREGLALKVQREFEPDLYVIWGSTLTDMKQYDEAIKLFDRAIALYPASSLLYYNKGLAFMAQEKYKEAELLYQKLLLQNPYMNSAHFQLAQAALKQGKVVPAMLGAIGYLLMSPAGRYGDKSIGMLSDIAKATDGVLAFKAKRTETPDANYQMMEEILLSKIALDKQYKPIIALDDPISRQIQVVLEKLEYDAGNKDFYVQYYLPYFQKVFKGGKFELLINVMFSDVNVTMIQDFNKKNKKAITAFTDDAVVYFNLIRSTRQLNLAARDTATSIYAFENGKLVGKGVLSKDGKVLSGPWTFYYASGNIKGKGLYSPTGQREGEWNFYYFNGAHKSTERYVAGKTQGWQDHYYENGNMSSHEMYMNGLTEGPVTLYYYGGAKNEDRIYKADKKDGIEKVYWANGNLKEVNTYANGVLNGDYKEYFKTGKLKAEGKYVDGKDEGTYKSYHEDGTPNRQMTFVKGKTEGEWTEYHHNGKLSEKRNYVGDVEEGLHQEFYDNGQLSASYNVKKGKTTGEALYYSKSGKVYATYQYDNGTIKAAKYTDASGKQLFASALKGNVIDVMTFNADGVKKRHFFGDPKGDLNGVDTTFYPSGKVAMITQHTKGQENGMQTAYYLNGKKKSEINMTEGKEDGYYQGYHPNGKLEVEGWVVNGVYQGEWLYYSINGKLSSKRNYLDSELGGYKEVFDQTGKKVREERYESGTLEEMVHFGTDGKIIARDTFPKGAGKYALLYANGKVREQGTLVNGNLNGIYKSFYFDGSPETSLFYKDGQLDSTYQAFYHGGTKMAERKYQIGSREGEWKNYFENGTVSRIDHYLNDQGNGLFTYFNPDGSKDVVYTYKNDDLNGPTQKFDPDGTLAYQVNYDDDLITGYTYNDKDGKFVPVNTLSKGGGALKAFYANGKPSREGAYSDGKKDGKTILYYTNGQVRAEDTVNFGLSEGLTKQWYPNGKLMSETPYAFDNVHGTMKEYHANGNLKKESVYVDGDNHGPVKYYDEAGKLTKTMLYENGVLIAVKNEK